MSDGKLAHVNPDEQLIVDVNMQVKITVRRAEPWQQHGEAELIRGLLKIMKSEKVRKATGTASYVLHKRPDQIVHEMTQEIYSEIPETWDEITSSEQWEEHLARKATV